VRREHRGVVGQRRRRIPIGGSGYAESTVDIRALECSLGVAVQAAAGVVVDHVEDLHGAAVGELPVGDVELPVLVGLLGLEPDVARLRSFVRFRTRRTRSSHSRPSDVVRS
jgi:hypothetical protein